MILNTFRKPSKPCQTARNTKAKDAMFKHPETIRKPFQNPYHLNHIRHLRLHLPHPHRDAGPLLELYGRGHRNITRGALRLRGGDAIQGPHDEDCHLCLGHLPGHHPRGLDARDARGHLLTFFPLFLRPLFV